MIEHTIVEMLSQRVYGLALGYEDINDHEQLRKDPVFGILAEREDLTGRQRRAWVPKNDSGHQRLRPEAISIKSCGLSLMFIRNLPNEFCAVI